MSLYVKHSMGGDYPPRIVCFVCGTEGPADYPLYTRYPKPFADSDDYTFYSFQPSRGGCRDFEASTSLSVPAGADSSPWMSSSGPGERCKRLSHLLLVPDEAVGRQRAGRGPRREQGLLS